MSNVIEKPKQTATIREQLLSEGMKKHLAMALPKHLTPERMVRVVLTAITRTPKLADCDPASFFKALFECSQMGLEPDGRRAHLIPFDKKKLINGEWKVEKTECQLIVDYKGLAELAYRSGRVKSIHSQEVRRGDIFTFDLGQVTQHVPWFLRTDANKPPAAGEVFAFYSVVEMAGDARKCEVMSQEEVDAIRDKSQGYQAYLRNVKKYGNSTSVWVEYPIEMGKKGLAIDTPIPTPGGWSTMGEMQVGDSVFDMHGKPTRVIAVSEVKHIDCFRVTFADGESIVCDDEHRWVARIDGVGRPDWPVHTVNELFAAKRVGLPVSMPVAGSLDLPDVPLAIDPWLLGYWLGNGTARAAAVTCGTDDAAHVTASIAAPFAVGTMRNDGRSKAVHVGIVNGFKVALRASMLLQNKHIPAEYLRASHGQRLRLLHGLMDSDGHVTRERGQAIFQQTSEVLARQVCELLASLGEKYNMTTPVCRGYGVEAQTYRIAWQPVNCPASMPRKAERFHDRKIVSYRGVESIVRTVTVPTKCIAVDSPSETYLAGRTMIPTHNTVFKRASKWLPLSSEIVLAMKHDDDGAVVDSDAVITRASVEDITKLLDDGVPLLGTEDEVVPVAYDAETVLTRFAGCTKQQDVIDLERELTDSHPEQELPIAAMAMERREQIKGRK